MGTEITGKKIAKNVTFSIAAQVVSLGVAFLLNLIVPKFISEYQYAYWQAYILYANYTGILHFGLLDGIVLRYSQYDYDQLDKKVFRSQFAVLMIVDTICTAIIIGASAILFTDQYFYVGVFVAVSVITRNIIKYASYSLQITNRIKQYATASIIQKAFYGVFVAVALLLKGRSFYWICAGELLGELVSFLWTSKFNKEIYIGKLDKIGPIIRETKENLSAGIFLLVSNWSAMFTIGATKMIIQWRWDELTFGKVAFAFSVTSLFLTFVSAISIVLFPALKRMKEEKLPGLYEKIRSILSPILVAILILYYPGAWILSKWLPKYNVSVIYLGLLLPIIIYRTRVSILTNNYLKAYRKERTLLVINIISVVLAIAGGLIISYVFNNIDLMLIFTVTTFMIMSILTEHVVCKLLNMRFIKENVYEAIMTIAFIVTAKYFTRIQGFAIYAALLAVYLFLNRKVISMYMKGLKKKKGDRGETT
jgi:O-antigen/teichoic acid export membrane protein